LPITYSLPNFNIPMNEWVPPNTPATGAPNYTGQLFQIYRYSRMVNWVYLASIDRMVPSIILRLRTDAAATPQRGWIFMQFTTPPTYYLALHVGVMHPGFPNQYRYVVTVQCDDTGAPITNL